MGNELENPENKLKLFKEEIQAFVDKEKTERETADFLFFLEQEGLNLNIDELLPEDMEIWEKVKYNVITREDLAVYKVSVEDPEDMAKTETGKFISPMRYAFYGFIINRAIPKIIEREVAEIEKLNNFKKEIQDIVEKEREQKKTAHFSESINTGELTPDDLEIWEKIKNETITMEVFTQYRESFNDEERETRKDIPRSRIEFLQFVSNKVGMMIMMKDMKAKGLL